MARAFTRRTFTKTAAAGACALGQAGCAAARAGAAEPAGSQKPNIIFILADDLGRGELGCYGQTKIRTPSIDRLAAEGMRFNEKRSTGAPIELYDLEADIGETTDVASRRPDVVGEIERVMSARAASPVKAWNWM